MPTGPWKVYLRWVKDSELFNEWMNPIDYETEEALQEQETLGLVLPAETGKSFYRQPEKNLALHREVWFLAGFFI